MKLLDLFCCEGGAGAGYARAGFDVVGVDINPQPRYPFEFHQGDALEFIKEHGHEFDAIHASPPCQGYSTITPDKSKHARMIEPTRDALVATGLPYVIENVEGARRHLDDPIRLCGSMFGLEVRRHRYFESNVTMWQPDCAHGKAPAIGVYGSHPDSREFLRPDGTRRGRRAQSVEEASRALGGVEWMSWKGMAQSIPPAYSEYIGLQLLDALSSDRQAAAS